MPTITEILPSGTTALPSSNVVLEQGGVATLVMRGTAGLEVEFLAGGATWVPFGSLSVDNRVRQVSGPGTYRVVRNAGVAAAADSVA